MSAFDIQAYLQENKDRVDRELDRLLPPETAFPPRLHRAMRYCIFAGGKRLRPILALASAQAVGGDPRTLLPEACALEMLHTYTLVHDDLPCMDDDDYRRGQPSAHKAFGEAAAILAGDALLTETFNVLAQGLKSSRQTAEIIQLVAQASGSQGLVGGQLVDLESEGRTIDQSLLEYIHRQKTGRLITASVMLGGILGGGTKSDLERLEAYGRAIGLVFQITDDILDVQGSTEKLGKAVGSDEKKGKATYPSIVGMAEAKKMQASFYETALDALAGFDEKAAEPLRQIAKLIIDRNN